MLMRSDMTGRVYVVTRYTQTPGKPDRFVAQEKFDVTEQFLAIAAELQPQEKSHD